MSADASINQAEEYGAAERFRSALTAAWDAAWNHGKVEALDAIHTDAFRRAHALRTAVYTRDDMKDIILGARAAFEDLTSQIDMFVIEGNTAAILWHGSGTHTGTFMGVPATGHDLRFFGSAFIIFDADGRIIEEVSTWSPNELLTAVGVLSFNSAERNLP